MNPINPDPAVPGSLEVAPNPSVPEGCYIAWQCGFVIGWGRLGVGAFPFDADRISLNPADVVRLERFEAEMEAEGHA
jgi:hypothetical protein